MSSTLTAIVSIFAALGIGSVLGAYFQARFQRRTQVGQYQHELKQLRYKAILILMLTKLDPDSRMVKTRDVRPDLRNLDDIDNELAMELLNGFIFASDDVLESLASFIRSPNHQSFVHTAVAMRKDLWGGRSAIGEQVLDGIGLVPRVEGQRTMD